MALPLLEYTGREDIRGGVYLPSELEHNAVNFSYRTSPSPPTQIKSRADFLHKSDPFGFFNVCWACT